MRLAIIGATGRTGRKATEQALTRGHSVTAIVRSSSLEDKDGLRVVIADPCKVEELIPALTGHDAVISCLGHRPGGNPWLVRDATAATLQAMQQVGLKRFIIVSGALLYPSRNPLVLVLKQMMADKLTDGLAAEAEITKSNADWTIVRPPRLQERVDTKGYRIVTGTNPKLTYRLQFQDLGKCLVDLSEGEKHAREIVGVASL